MGIINTRKLGNQGLTTSAIGLGCMGMSFAYGTADESEAIKVIHRALELGVNFLDTAERYGPYKNEELIGRAIKGKRDQAVIATKFGFKYDEAGNSIGLDSHPKTVKAVAEASMKRLESMLSISTINIALIQMFLLKKQLAPWLNWSKKAKFATSDYLKLANRPFAEPTKYILFPLYNQSIQSGNAT
jgi:hypothetical protein